MLQVTVCVGSSCYLRGSWQVIEALQAAVAARSLDELVELRAGFCHGDCRQGVVVKVGERVITGVTPESAARLVLEQGILPEVSDRGCAAHQAGQL